MTGEKIKEKAREKEKERRVGGFYCPIKRLCDLLAAYILLLILYIPMLIIALAIKLTSKGGVIFRQIRVGKDGVRFVCYKFRTMRSDAPSQLSTAEFTDADKYITAVGRFLRKTSLDELPQLFNVLNGDMSIVGPRPLIPSESEVHKRRSELGVYSVRPGITGLAQVCGRDTVSDGEKVRYDAEYTENLGALTDMKIILLTFFKVCSCEGVGLSGEKERS
ncbi:MAG: sugar transferase [Clostridia bacterium]|nr:sugar transferase [Clostridia bacterium]